MQQGPFSIAYQIVQECMFKCDICHRRYEKGEEPISPEERRQMVDILKEYGLKRLTVTGGEPILLGDELFDFLRYVHDKHIHVCLSSTGYGLTRERLVEMDAYVDQFLLPVRSLNREGWQKDFGDSKKSLDLFEMVINLLQWLKTTGIRVVISTVVHKENIGKIIDLGWQLYSLNPNVIWNIEQYYAMGIRANIRARFEVEDQQYERICDQARQIFGNLFRGISVNDKRSRLQAPDFLITPRSDLVKTSGNRVGRPQGNILARQIPFEFKMRHPWSHYKDICRDWGWDDMSYEANF